MASGLLTIFGRVRFSSIVLSNGHQRSASKPHANRKPSLHPLWLRPGGGEKSHARGKGHCKPEDPRLETGSIPEADRGNPLAASAGQRGPGCYTYVFERRPDSVEGPFPWPNTAKSAEKRPSTDGSTAMRTTSDPAGSSRTSSASARSSTAASAESRSAPAASGRTEWSRRRRKATRPSICSPAPPRGRPRCSSEIS